MDRLLVVVVVVFVMAPSPIMMITQQILRIDNQSLVIAGMFHFFLSFSHLYFWVSLCVCNFFFCALFSGFQIFATKLWHFVHLMIMMIMMMMVFIVCLFFLRFFSIPSIFNDINQKKKINDSNNLTHSMDFFFLVVGKMLLMMMMLRGIKVLVVILFWRKKMMMMNLFEVCFFSFWLRYEKLVFSL